MAATMSGFRSLSAVHFHDRTASREGYGGLSGGQNAGSRNLGLVASVSVRIAEACMLHRNHGPRRVVGRNRRRQKSFRPNLLFFLPSFLLLSSFFLVVGRLCVNGMRHGWDAWVGWGGTRACALAVDAHARL